MFYIYYAHVTCLDDLIKVAVTQSALSLVPTPVDSNTVLFKKQLSNHRTFCDKRSGNVDCKSKLFNERTNLKLLNIKCNHFT